jgi:hypothetical protein
MSVAHALAFINLVRTEEALRARVAELSDQTRYEPLLRLGMERGLNFTAQELQTAFQYDWTMRRLRFETPQDR